MILNLRQPLEADVRVRADGWIMTSFASRPEPSKASAVPRDQLLGFVPCLFKSRRQKDTGLRSSLPSLLCSASLSVPVQTALAVRFAIFVSPLMIILNIVAVMGARGILPAKPNGQYQLR